MIPNESPLTIILTVDKWNDYSYQTLFEIILFDENSVKYNLGYVKIGHFGQMPMERKELPGYFNCLPANFFIRLR